MKRLDTGEFVADDDVIREEKRKDALIKEVIGDLKYLCLDDQVAGLCHGLNGWTLDFYGNAIEKAIDITNKILGTKVNVNENVKVKETVHWRERPVIGGIDIATERSNGLTCGTIGWVANKADSSSRGIITVEHAVIVNGWVNNYSSNPSDRIARTESAFNNSYVDASYSPFVYGIDGSPSIKNIGNVIGWMGYYSVQEGMNVSFNGWGSGGRRDTVVIDKGTRGGKLHQICIEQELLEGDSGSACVNYNPDTGNWVLVCLNRIQLYLVINGVEVPYMGIGSSIDSVNNYTDTYPYLV
jgi:hypothetical protein